MMDRIISLAEQVRGEFGGRTIFQTAENSGYLFENNRRYIIINKSLDKLLQQTVCAHEFGHDMLHRELSAGGIRESSLFLATNKTEREANLFAAEILLTDKETLSVMSYASAMEEAAFELGVVPQILSYKLELLNHKGHHFNITDTASDFLK